MLINAKTALAVVFVFGVASASVARDGGGPPTIDIQKTCRENIAALRSLLGSDILQNMEVCMSDEQSAQEQLRKDWATYPALAKSQCVKPQEYLPGYIEWLVCIEITRDVLQTRKQEASASGSSASRKSSKLRAAPANAECPVVRYTEEGSVDYVINC